MVFSFKGNFFLRCLSLKALKLHDIEVIISFDPVLPFLSPILGFLSVNMLLHNYVIDSLKVNHISLVVRKVSDQVRHKPGCTTTEYSYRLEISNLGGRRIVLSV